MSISDTINSLSKKYPNPTNALALAATSAADYSTTAGLSAYAIDAFTLPRGVIPRMRLLSVGWSKRGDAFHAAVDSSWWSAKYGGPLWPALLSWYGLLEKSGIVPAWNWDDTIANGSPLSIGYALNSAQSDLAAIVAAGWSRTAPYLVPTRSGALPLPNPLAVPDSAVDEPGRVVDIVRTATTIPWWLWVVIGGAVALHIRSRRG